MMNLWRRAVLSGAVLATVAAAAPAQTPATPPPSDPPAPPGQPGQPVPPTPPTDPQQPAPPTFQTPEVPLSERPEARLQLSIRTEASWTLRSDLDDSPGDVAVYRAGLGVAAAKFVSERLRLSLEGEAEASWYDFDNATGLIPGTDDPFNDVYRFNLRPSAFIIQSRQVSWFVGGLMEIAGEGDADVGDSITGGGYGGIRYQVSETLALSLGAAVKTRLEDSVLFVPYFGVEWDVSDRVRLETEATGLRISAKVRDDLSVYLRGRWELRDYRLDDDGPLPSGVVRDFRVPVGVGLTWQPTPRISVELEGGAIAFQHFRIDNSDGEEISETDTDPTGYIRLAARFAF